MMWYPTLDILHLRWRLLRALKTVLAPLFDDDAPGLLDELEELHERHSATLAQVELLEENVRRSSSALREERERTHRVFTKLDRLVANMPLTPLVLACHHELNEALGRKSPPPRETLAEGLARLGIPMGPGPKKEA